MSQSVFETINSLLEIWKNIIQSVMFLVLWKVLSCGKKRQDLERGFLLNELYREMDGHILG